MKNYRVWKGIQFVLFALVGCFVFGFVVKELWNWLMPGIFHLGMISFWQALGLLVLSKILFGGFHRHAGGRGRRGWKEQMEKRWAGMTDEERERFRSGMGRRGWGRWCEPREQAGREQAAG